MKNFLTAAGIALVATAPLCAGELSPESLAKIVKIVAGGAGTPGKVACSNAALKAELAKIGVASDPSCRVAWASSLNEVKSLKAAGKFVMCGKVEWLTAGGPWRWSKRGESLRSICTWATSPPRRSRSPMRF